MKMCDLKIMEKSTQTSVYQKNSRRPSGLLENYSQPHHAKHGSLAFLTKCNFATNMLALENLPIFYEMILNYWSEFKNSTGYDFKSRHKDEILWNNRNILIAKKIAFYKHWFDAGISKIEDLLNRQKGF